MVTHYYTLRTLSREFDSLLRGASLEEVFTQKKNELIATLRVHQPAEMQYALTISVDPRLNYCFLREQSSRAKKNSVDLFHEIIGLNVVNVSMHSSDRILSLVLSNGWKLSFQLYNTVESNIILVDEQNNIRDTFKNKKELDGTVFTAGEEHHQKKTIIQSNDVFRAVNTDHAKTVFQALKQIVPLLGSTYTREVLHRVRIDEKRAVRELNDEDLGQIRETAENILREMEHPRPVLYTRGEEPAVLSMIPLQHLSGLQSETFGNVNEAVRNSIAKKFRSGGIESEKKTLMNNIKSELERTRRSIEAIREHVAGSLRAQEYEHIGNVIMANLQHLTKGTNRIDIPDVYNEGNNIHVVLDPKLTPARNAERYFEKAKKSRAAQAQSEEQMSIAENKRTLLEKFLLHLDQCQTHEQVKEFRQEYKKELLSMKLIPREKGEEQLPFRLFTVAGGFEVLVGKSSANNDLLTMKYAKPNDLWFHVRGAGGSHTVLRVAGHNAVPSKEAILQAAAIAAYYSKMRKARNIPVAYCERKYVRKPKGLAEGAVMLEREKVVFVNPGLPE